MLPSRRDISGPSNVLSKAILANPYHRQFGPLRAAEVRVNRSCEQHPPQSNFLGELGMPHFAHESDHEALLVQSVNLSDLLVASRRRSLHF